MPQRNIACYELLAQTVLLAFRGRFIPAGTPMMMHGFSDNTPTEGAVNKLFTTARPLCHFLQNLAAWTSRWRLSMEISHIPGEQNELADGLSRSKQEILGMFNPERRLPFVLHDKQERYQRSAK